MTDSVLRRLRLAAGRAAAAALRQAPDAETPADAWARMRAPQKEPDRVLVSDTHLWLRRIPSRLHPKHLCRYHPRLANRLVQCWGDRERLEQFMDDLLIDRRGGRRGLTQRVVGELEDLERFHAARPGARRDLVAFNRRAARGDAAAWRSGQPAGTEAG